MKPVPSKTPCRQALNGQAQHNTVHALQHDQMQPRCRHSCAAKTATHLVTMSSSPLVACMAFTGCKRVGNTILDEFEPASGLQRVVWRAAVAQ